MFSKKDPSRKDKPVDPHSKKPTPTPKPSSKPSGSSQKPPPKAQPAPVKVQAPVKAPVKAQAPVKVQAPAPKPQQRVTQTSKVTPKIQPVVQVKPLQQSTPKPTTASKPQTITHRPKPICSVCLDLDYALLNKATTSAAGFKSGLQELVQSAKTCVTCSVICQATKHCYPEVYTASALFCVSMFFYGGDENQFPHESFAVSVSPKEFPASKEDPLRRIAGGWRTRVLHIYSIPGKPCPWPTLKPGTIPSSDPRLLADQVRLWINDCEKHHGDCRTATKNFLPKRVIQLLPGSTPGNCRVRLCETTSSHRGPYIALSHCWGKNQIIVTNKDTYPFHRNEISWNALSTTFKDAIDFTCRLGVEFIWIDSLCIIQGSKADWEQEAVKMASYYSNAHLTIAASGAVDGSIGLFPRLPGTERPLDISGNDGLGRPFNLIARTVIDHPFDVDEDERDRFPLTKRGWVFQEHILSRRFLHFGPRELTWECHSDTHCQCGMIPTRPRSDHVTNQVLSTAKFGLDTKDLRSCRKLWYENVESIMNMDFTYLSDRLAAAAGVASLLSKGYKGRYLAGLWEDSLLQDLCWAVLEDGRRPDDLRNTPSWSWGSVSGGLATLYCQGDLSDPNVAMTSRLVTINCLPNTPSFIGNLTQGILTLDGLFTPATVRLTNVKGVISKSLTLGTGRDEKTFKDGWAYLPDALDLWTKNPIASIYLLEISRRIVQGQKVDSVYLALQAHKTKRGSFERVGLVRGQTRRGPPQVMAESAAFMINFDSFAKMSRVQIE